MTYKTFMAEKTLGSLLLDKEITPLFIIQFFKAEYSVLEFTRSPVSRQSILREFKKQ
jgi:hypothetical protein